MILESQIFPVLLLSQFNNAENSLIPSHILILQHAVLTDTCFNPQKEEFIMMESSLPTNF